MAFRYVTSTRNDKQLPVNMGGPGGGAGAGGVGGPAGAGGPGAGGTNNNNNNNYVGEYILVGQEIGRGSFANVYLARSPSSGRLVAVKSVLREKLNRKLAENLESEIAILKRIQHDHIVGLLDIVKTDRHIHLIMEYCSMGDLSAYIKRKGIITDSHQSSPAPSPPSFNPLAGPLGGLAEFVVRHFLRQLASAMEFLRAHSLIHRDLKPQ
ncbi:Serine/threonine-protein kinase, partial [Quaeritorhiza haematococci]